MQFSKIHCVSIKITVIEIILIENCPKLSMSSKTEYKDTGFILKPVSISTQMKYATCWTLALRLLRLSIFALQTPNSP